MPGIGSRRPSAARAAVLLAVALAATSGCSWLFVQPLPADHSPYQRATCTTNRTAPVLDTIFTITNLAAVIYVLGQDHIDNKGSRVGFGLSVASLWGMSAGYGYSKTSECEEVANYEPRYQPVRPRPRLVPVPRPAAAPPPAVVVEPPAT